MNQNVLHYYFGTLLLDAIRYLHFAEEEKNGLECMEFVPRVTEAFINLTQKDIIQGNDFQLIERYVVLLYDTTSPLTSVNECRQD